MPEPILVTGGTGRLGSRLVPRLATATDREIRLLTRSSRESTLATVRHVTGDLRTGEGLASAVDGVKTVVHCASDTKGDAEAAQHLVRALSQAGEKPHLVHISIVGVDQVSFGYFRSKHEAEQVVTGSGLPWTVLRVTQFYEFVLEGAEKAARYPFVPVPARFLVQPVDTRDVAARLTELALAEPAGRVPDLAGPEVFTADEMIRAYLRARGRRRPVLPLWMPGTAQIRSGALLPSSEAAGVVTGRRTWAEFLAEELQKDEDG